VINSNLTRIKKKLNELKLNIQYSTQLQRTSFEVDLSDLSIDRRLTLNLMNQNERESQGPCLVRE